MQKKLLLAFVAVTLLFTGCLGGRKVSGVGDIIVFVDFQPSPMESQSIGQEVYQVELEISRGSISHTAIVTREEPSAIFSGLSEGLWNITGIAKDDHGELLYQGTSSAVVVAGTTQDVTLDLRIKKNASISVTVDISDLVAANIPIDEVTIMLHRPGGGAGGLADIAGNVATKSFSNLHPGGYWLELKITSEGSLYFKDIIGTINLPYSSSTAELFYEAHLVPGTGSGSIVIDIATPELIDKPILQAASYNSSTDTVTLTLENARSIYVWRVNNTLNPEGFSVPENITSYDLAVKDEWRNVTLTIWVGNSIQTGGTILLPEYYNQYSDTIDVHIPL